MAARDPFASPFLGEDPIQRSQRIQRRRTNWRNTVLRRQRILKAAGFNVEVDGNWSKNTSSSWWRHNRNLAPLAGRPAPKPAPVGTRGDVAAERAKVFQETTGRAPDRLTPAQRAVRNAKTAAKRAVPRIARPDLSHATARALSDAPRRTRGVPDRQDPVPTARELLVRDDLRERRVSVVEQTIKADAQARFVKAWQKRDTPTKWDSRDIVSLFADPLTQVKGWHRKREWVERVQVWLAASQDVQVTGVWDAQTADAFKSEMVRRQRNYTRFRATQLARRIYRPLGISPGEQGFPVLGKAPTPEALLKIVDAGGFTATMLMKELARRLQDLGMEKAWRNYQDEFLDSLLAGGGAVPEAASVFGPFVTPLMLDQMTPAQKSALVLWGFAQKGIETENDPARRGDTFYQEVRALAESMSPEDLKRRVAVVREADEKVFQFKKAVDAESDNFLFNGAKAVVHALAVPAEESQDALASLYGGVQALVDPDTWEQVLARGSQTGGSEGLITANAELNQEIARSAALARAGWAQWEQDHAVLGFVTDLIVDPLNLIPATWVADAWKGSKAGVRAVAKAGEITKASTAERALPLRLVGGATGTALQLPAAYGIGVQAGLRASRAAVRQSKVGRLGRAMKENIDDVSTTVATAFSHGFKPSTPKDPADVAQTKDAVRKHLEGVEATDPTTGRTFNILDELERHGVDVENELLPLFAADVNLAARQRLSLFTHRNYQTVSDYGARQRATLASFSWSMHADKHAAKLAKEEHNRVLDEVDAALAGNAKYRALTREVHAALQSGDEDAIEKAWARWHKFPTTQRPRTRRTAQHRIPTIRDPQNLRITDAEFEAELQSVARSASERVYRQMMKDAGTYLGGGKFEVMRLIEQKVIDTLDLYDSVIAPALQSAIERSVDDFEQHLVASGKRPSSWTPQGLFTETGYALGNRSKSQDLLRDILRDTFDDLDVKYGPSPDRAGHLPSVKKYRAARIAEVNEEFSLQEQALKERGESLDEELAARKAALRGAHPILIGKRDGSIIFGADVAPILERGQVMRSHVKDYYLAEARLGGDNKVQSLSQKIVDLETGELRYDPGDFADADEVTTVGRGESSTEATNADPKFRKALDDLKRLNKRIAEMQNRKRQAARARDERIRSESWTERDQLDLNNLRAAKRRLIKTNPATETYFVRGKAKRNVQSYVENLLTGDIGKGLDVQRAKLVEEKAAALREVEEEVRELQATKVDTRKRSHVDVQNADLNRVFTEDEYDEFVAMMVERRSRSVHQWAARRRAVGDMTRDAVDAAVTKEMDEWTSLVKSWFKPQSGGTFKMTAKRIKVPAIYARHHFKAYDDALKGRHPILTADDVDPDVKRILSLGATPADRAPGAVENVERMAAILTGARPYPVWKKFTEPEDLAGQAVKGRKLTFERSVPNRVGVPAGSRWAAEAMSWGDRVRQMKAGGWTQASFGGGEPTNLVGRFDAYRGLLKVASQYAYPRVSKSQWAWVRALHEAQSGPLQTINELLGMGRELFVFSVLPARPAATVRNVLDSVAKVLVMGMHDPRYWFVGGKTAGERAAHKNLAAVSKDFAAVTMPNASRIPGAIRGYLDSAQRVEQYARGVFDDTPLGKAQREALETVTNVFQLGVNQLDIAMRLLGGPKYGDLLADRLRHVFNTSFWARPVKDVRKMLAVNSVDVPDEVIFGIQQILRDGEFKNLAPRERVSLEDWAAINRIKEGDVEAWIKEVTANPKLLNNTRHPVFVMLSHTADVNWDLMVGRVEGFLRRGLYRSVHAKAMKRHGDTVRAHTEALQAVDKSLFDYSKMTTLEENFKHVAPFLFFWRRNLGFWAMESVRKPYLPAALVKFDEMMETANSDQPEWSRRYVRVPMLNDALAKLPVVNWLFQGEGGFEVGFDPLSYLSAAPLYRAFRGENPTLPADRAGLPFISQLVEGINSFGLTFSPWFRKPLELTGVLDYRAWQSMFPQNGVVDVVSERFLNEMFPGGLNFEETLQDSLFEAIGVDFSAKELNEKRINEFVQLEVAAQAERGEPVDRAAAEEKVRRFIYLQTIFAFTAGSYLRHLDPAQLHLYRIQQQLVEGELDFLDLTEREQRAYRLFIRRKLNPGAYNAYLNALPKIETYHALEDFDQAQDFLQANPEVIPHVQPAYTKKPAFGKGALQNISLIVQGGATIEMLKSMEAAGIDEPGVRDTLQRHFVTPELQEFWGRNDSAKQLRDKMLRGQVFGYLRGLRQDYFALPENDHAAKQKFLADNPILAHSFTLNDEASDDLRDVLNYVNNDLREAYFEMVERNDWDGAAEFLKRFPRIFEFTKAENRVSDDGTWLPAGRNTQRSKDYVAARPHIEHYFALKKQSKERAYKWLQGDTPGAKLARAYFKQYGDATKGTRSEHAKAYLALKPTLTWFFESLPKEGEFRGFYSKWEWVFESNDPQAVRLRDYFRKYGDKNGMSQQAKDYVAVKSPMQRYFDLKEKDAQAASEFLHSSAGAGVLAYFKKYGKTNAAARKWGSWVKSRNPEVNRRLQFWKRYFELEPDQRPAFVHGQAENYGVFIWGIEGDRARHEKEAAYLRAAKKRHLTPKQALYLRVKPLLDLMHTLDKNETKILLRLNPDVREWLDKFGKGPQTGSKELDRKVEAYFGLEPDSNARAEFLRSNPEVQDYFDRKNPADAAMHNLLEAYFAIEDPKERNEYRDLHPEISDYFERKREEKSLLRAELQVFDDADPRDAELRERAQFEIVHAAEVMWARLRGDSAARLAGDDIEVRRERDEERRKKRRAIL